MSRIAHILQAMARHEVDRKPFIEFAVVTSVFDDESGPDAHTINVKLKDSGLPITKIPVATLVSGAAHLPRVGDVVVLAFPRGDLGSAVMVAQVYSDERRPPPLTRDEIGLSWPGDSDDPETKAVSLRIRADGSDRELAVTLGGDKDAALRVADGLIELRSGGATIEISHSSSSDAAIELSAGGTRVRLDQDGDLTLESSANVTIKGRQVAIEGETQVSINGQIVEIN